MEYSQKQISPEQVGAQLAKLFQGWHVSNMQAAGRTLYCWAVQNSEAGKQIEKQLQASNAMNEGNVEVKAMKDSPDNFEPVRIRIRGGSDYCATTLCDVKGYYTPTNSYLLAKDFVLQAMRATTAEAQYNYAPPPATSIAGQAGNLSTMPTSVFTTPQLLQVYKASIDLAKKIRTSTEAGWRDPRSRQAVETQFASMINSLVFQPI